MAYVASKSVLRTILTRGVIVAALGYFVDMYDLVLYGIVRQPSLLAIGVPLDLQAGPAVFILNWQMTGMFLGGVLWGVLGDKKGRLSVLFGSIAVYSLANLANAFVQSVEQYAALRFIAGVGLAGELGAGITLVSETLPKHLRGWGTSIVASLGILGASAAWFVGYGLPNLGVTAVDWRMAYIIGGVMGIALLIMRIAMAESGMFHKAQRTDVKRGNLMMLVNDRKRFNKYVFTNLAGVPVWFVNGVLLTLAPELYRALGGPGAITAATALLFGYLGSSSGGLFWGAMSQIFQNRKMVLVTALASLATFMFTYVFWTGISPGAFYAVCFFVGISKGYWSVFVTMAAEQFGTNLRATVTTTAPNFVRGATVPVTLTFVWLSDYIGLLKSAMLVGSAVILVALIAVRNLEETFHKDLDYVDVETVSAPAPLMQPSAFAGGK